MTTTFDLATLRARAIAASPGPYELERRDDDNGEFTYVVYGGAGDTASCAEDANDNARANAAFIADCGPQVVLALLDELEAAQAALNPWPEVCEFMKCNQCGLPAHHNGGNCGYRMTGEVFVTEGTPVLPTNQHALLVEAEIHHNARLVNARLGELADKILGLQPAESKPIELLQKLDDWYEGKNIDVYDVILALKEKQKNDEQ